MKFFLQGIPRVFDYDVVNNRSGIPFGKVYFATLDALRSISFSCEQKVLIIDDGATDKS